MIIDTYIYIYIYIKKLESSARFARASGPRPWWGPAVAISEALRGPCWGPPLSPSSALGSSGALPSPPY